MPTDQRQMADADKQKVADEVIRRLYIKGEDPQSEEDDCRGIVNLVLWCLGDLGYQVIPPA